MNISCIYISWFFPFLFSGRLAAEWVRQGREEGAPADRAYPEREGGPLQAAQPLHLQRGRAAHARLWRL